MVLPHWVTAVREARELWSAVAGSLLAVVARQALVRAGAVRRDAWVSLVLVAGLVAGTAAGAHKWGVVLAALAVALVAGDRERPAAPEVEGVALSVMAASALYACLPDTEVALALLGAASTTGAAALLFRLPWHGAALTTTAVLLAATVADGQSRATALVGGGAIAVVHALATLPARERVVPRVLVVSVVVTAMIICSRVAGRGSATVPSVLIAAGCVVVVGVVTLVTSRSASGARQRLGPLAGDD